MALYQFFKIFLQKVVYIKMGFLFFSHWIRSHTKESEEETSLPLLPLCLGFLEGPVVLCHPREDKRVTIWEKVLCVTYEPINIPPAFLPSGPENHTFQAHQRLHLLLCCFSVQGHWFGSCHKSSDEFKDKLTERFIKVIYKSEIWSNLKFYLNFCQR